VYYGRVKRVICVSPCRVRRRHIIIIIIIIIQWYGDGGAGVTVIQLSYSFVMFSVSRSSLKQLTVPSAVPRTVWDVFRSLKYYITFYFFFHTNRRLYSILSVLISMRSDRGHNVNIVHSVVRTAPISSIYNVIYFWKPRDKLIRSRVSVVWLKRLDLIRLRWTPSAVCALFFCTANDCIALKAHFV